MSISAFQAFIGEFEDVKTKELTTTAISEQFVKAENGGKGAPYINKYIGMKDEDGKPYLATATVFVSHAWQYKFYDVVFTAMQQHANEYANTYFWFDLFTNNQHDVADKSFEWFCTTFQDMIRSIGSTLLILSPWHDPVLLRRVWCLFEVYNALETSGKLHIQVPGSEREILAEAVVQDSDCLIQKLSNIRIEKAQATIASDKDLILKVIQNSEGGYYGVSKQVKDRLRAWYMEQLDDLVCESPDNHHLRVVTAEICSSFGNFGQALEHASLSLTSDEVSIKFKSYCVTGRVYAAQNKFQLALTNYDEALIQYQELKGIEDDKVEIRDCGLSKEMGYLYLDRCEVLMQNLLIQAGYGSLQKGMEILADEFGGLDSLTPQELVPMIPKFKKTVSLIRNIEFITQILSLIVTEENDGGRNSTSDPISYLFEGEVNGDKLDMMLKATEMIEQEGIHHQLPDLYHIIGLSYLANQQFNDALAYFHRSLKIKRELFGEIHLDIADILRDIGATYHQLGDVDEAFSHMRQSVEIREIVTGNNSLGVALAYQDLASVHDERGEYAEALQLIRGAFFIMLHIFGMESYHASIVCLKMNQAHNKLFYAEAMKLDVPPDEEFGKKLNNNIHSLPIHKFSVQLHDDSRNDAGA